MEKFLRRVGGIFLILVCMLAIFPAYSIIMELEHESQGQIFGDLYIFDPKKIFDEYKEGKKNLFLVISWEDLDDGVYEDLPEYPPSKWKQQDYLATLNIFHETIFERSVPRKIRGARFSIPDCNQISFGPQSAVFFTATIDFPNATYYSYDIDLNNGNITWHGNNYQPIISWPISSFDLSMYEISVEEALQIAEENGGKKFRLANQNKCTIDINISSTRRTGKWVISYDSTIDQFTTLLSIEIDAKTGKHKIIAEGGAGYYKFDPSNIKESISEGKTDIFKILTMPLNTSEALPPVSWTQEDYYQIAKAFDKIVLGEDLDDWKIHFISFDLDCDDVLFGLQQMHFAFWQVTVLKRDYFVQRIKINPTTGMIEWNHEYDYDVNPFSLFNFGKKTIDKSWIKVPADEALRIAYEAEGTHLHQALIWTLSI